MDQRSNDFFRQFRTQSGGTIPIEIQPITGDLVNWKDLVPDIVAIDRLTDEVFIFVFTIPHETELESTHTEILNYYHQGITAMRRSFKSTVNFFAVEIGTDITKIQPTNSKLKDLQSKPFQDLDQGTPVPHLKTLYTNSTS